MSVWNSFKTKAVAVIRRVLSLTDPTSWPDDGLSHSGEYVTAERVLGLSTAWACVNLHAGTIGSLPCIVYRKNKDGSREVATDHWLYRLVHDSPNADQTALDFWEFMQAVIELRGNSYAYAPKARDGRTISLQPIPADYVTVKRNASGALEYSYPNEKGEPQTRRQDEMFHIRGFGGGPLGGLSTLTFGRHVFGLAIATDKAASGTFKNGLRAAGILKFKDWLKPDQRKETREYLEREHTGAANSGKPLVLEGGVEWATMSLSPEDAQMLQSRSFDVEQICRFFQAPPVLVGHTEKVSAWGSGIEQIIQGYIKFGLRRRCKRIEQAIQKQLLTAGDRAAGIYVEFNLEGLLRGDPKARAEFYRVMTASGIMSINECRRLENLPPVPGGDVPRLQQQNVPLGMQISNGQLVSLPEPEVSDADA